MPLVGWSGSIFSLKEIRVLLAAELAERRIFLGEGGRRARKRNKETDQLFHTKGFYTN